MAEPYFVAVSPHNSNSTTVALGATLQVAAAIPNFLMAESFINLEEFGRQIAVTPFEVSDGYIQVPKAPGLGIELDEEALASHPHRDMPLRPVLHPGDEGP
jgi:galactonate dehydratase